MKEEKETHSELDKFFQSQLNKVDTESDGWDMPSADVLSGAFAEMDSDKPKKRFVWWWFVGGLVVLSIGGLAVWNSLQMKNIDGKLSKIIEHNQNHEVEDSFNSQAKELDRTKKSMEDTDKSAEVTPSVDAEIKVILKNPMSPFEVKSSKSISPSTKKNKLKKPKRVGDSITTKKNTDQSIKKDSALNEQSVNTEIDRTDSMMTGDHTTSQIATVDTASKKSKTTTSNDSTYIGVPILSTNKAAQRIYMLGGINTSTIWMTSKSPLPDNLKKYDNWYKGHQFGIGYSRKKTDSRVGFSIELGYMLMRNQSLFQNESVYDSLNIGVGTSGQPIYNEQLGIESPIGPYQTALEIGLQNRKFEPGDIFKNSTEITNSFRIIQVKPAINYSLITRNRLKVLAVGGIGVNYIQEMKQQMYLSVQSNNEPIGREEYNTTLNDDLKRVYYDVFLGINVHYQITNQLDVGFNPSFSSARTSIRKVVGPDKVATYSNVFTTNFTVGFNF